MLPPTWSPVLDAFWQMQTEIPIFLVGIAFFVPKGLVPPTR